MRKLLLAIIFLLPAYYFAQCPGAAVSYTIDLSSNPDSVWISPAGARNGYACAATGAEKCISVVITLNPATTVLNFDIATGAVPSGSNFYTIDCGAGVLLGQPSCVSGLTTFCLSYCKPGLNTNTYRVSASRNYHPKQDTTIRQNCSKLLAVNELSAPSVTWTSVNPGVPGQYNSYLSCTSGCSSSNVSPTAGAPSFIDYKISGNDAFCSLPVIDTVRVFVDPAMTVAISPTNGFVCTGGSPPVTLTATPTGGTGPYTYSWNPGLETTQLIDTVPAGTYTVNVTDNTPGCAAETQTVTIASVTTPAAPSPSSNSPVCEASALNLNATAAGGVTYLWTGPNGFISSLQNPSLGSIPLAGAGTYTVEVTQNGCTSLPATTNVSVNALDDASFYYSTSTFCQTGTNPLPTITGLGGGNFSSTAGLVFVDNSTGEISLAGSTLGTYNVSYTTIGACPNTSAFIVTITTAPDATFTYNLNYCNSESNPLPSFGGGASAGTFSATGGLFFISTITGEINLASNTPGTYVVTNTIAAAGGCSSASADFTVTITPNPTVSAGLDQTVCANNSNVNLNGSVTLATGGMWTTAGTGTFSPSNTVLNPTYTPGPLDIISGSVSLTLTTTGNGNCSASNDVVVVSFSPAPTVNAGPDQSVCIGVNSIALSGNVAVASGGSWSTPGSGVFSPSNTMLNTTYQIHPADELAGSVSLVLTSTGNVMCLPVTDTMVVIINPLPAPTFAVSSDSICIGSFSNISLVNSGADIFNWTPGGNTGSSVTVSPVSNTTYTVALSNSITGCSDTLVQTITVLPPLSVTTTPTNVSCFGFADGSVNTNVSGTFAPLTYMWSNGVTSANLSNLTVGTYTLNVTDANTCAGSSTVTITQPSAISLLLTPTNVNCGQSNGVITSSISNGTAPYTYMWSNGDSGTLADSLSPGLYKLEILDINGCQGMATTIVGALNGATISLNTITNVTCNGASDGAISTTITGGTAPLSILWNNGGTTNTITNLQAGVYDVDVTDAAGCNVSASFVLSEPASFLISETVTNAACGVSDGSISTVLSGGTPAYTYQWSANAGSAITPGVSLLPAGFYTVTVTDAQACVATKVISVANTTNSIGVVLNSILPSTCGNPVGIIDVSVGGNAPPFTYSWSTGQISEDMLSVIPGNYSLMVSDASSCNSISNYTIPSNIAGYIPQICLVTVNDTSNMNRVVWEKQYGFGIKHYNIYRETSVQGNYLRVASVPFGDLSVFQDTVANTNNHSWRYKLSAVDSCNIETGLSAYQKTIHRSITPNAITGNVQLRWDYYDGAVFTNYHIYRELGTAWELIDSVSNTIFNYEDVAPPAMDLDYYIEAQLQQVCNPTMRMGIGGKDNDIQTVVVKSKSNIKNNRTIGIKDSKNQDTRLKVYPNPAIDLLNVEVYLNKEAQAIITIENMLGQIVFTKQTTQSLSQLNISTFVPGVYLVKVKANNTINSTKLIIQK